MNDANGKGSSCLAITEKKNQRVGGCIGVFFQLFDWNRSLTKKKLFKKLPPPAAGAKQASSKKFKGDEQMPNSKIHLIDNENSGGFPSAKKGVNRVIEAEQKQEVRVPGLVARLMGLESIPASRRDRSKKSSSADYNEEKESLYNHNGERVDLELGVGSSKHDDSRPQKLQKTGTDEKGTMTRFGAEALQIKSVLSQVRKYNHHHHHHHTLKSLRVPSGKSASRRSRLIGAATKILEPGMQATNKGKHSLTSSTSISPPKPLVGHKSCKNCGNLLDVVEISSPIVSDMFIPSHENDVVLLRSREKIITLVDEDGKNNAQSCNESFTKRMLVPAKRDSSRQLFGAQEDDDEVSFAFKLKTQTQEQVLSSEKVSSGSIISNMQEKRVLSAGSTKEFVALNRSLGGRSRIRSPTKMDSCKYDLERKPSNKHDGSSSPISTLERKRRTSSVPRIEAINSGNLVTVKQKYASSDTQGGKRRSFDASIRNNYNVKSIQGGQLNTDKINDNKVNEAVSYTFSSPSMTKIVIPAGKKERKSNNEVKTDFQRLSPSTVDALGAILEQKLKELSCQENQELATCRPLKNSTAMILQELISVLNLKHPTCSDDNAFSDKYETSHVRLLGTSSKGNNLSPGSVLAASFSSSSVDEGSAYGFHLDSMNCSNDQLDQLEHGAELLDSATTFDKGRMIGYEILTELANQIHSALQSLKSCGIRLTENYLIHVQEVIFNVELVLGNATEHSEDGMPQQLLISCFLHDELNTMASDSMWRDLNGFAGFRESKDRGQIKGFLFDCVIEYLESKCCQDYYHTCVFKAWTKLPSSKKAKMLVQEVKSEVKKWACTAGMLPDQVIEWEMSHSFGKWTGFNIEAFEVGVDIGGFVLQILVDEIVEELLDSWRGHILKNLPKSCY